MTESSRSLLSMAAAWLKQAGTPPGGSDAVGPHAQFGEDRILQAIFEDREGGYCAEIGAYDGLTGSATLVFERRGWDCLLVEPNPDLVSRIRSHRAGTVVGCAASSTEGEATFYVADNVEQMSTLEPDSDHHSWVRKEGGEIRQTTVRTARLDTLLEEAGFPQLDFITIDVEGHELEALQGLTLERYQPKVVILEENTPRWRSAIAKHMAAHGYVNFKRTGVNEWYARATDRSLIDPVAVRRFRRQKQILRVVGAGAAMLAQYTPDRVKRLLYGTRDRLLPGS